MPPCWFVFLFLCFASGTVVYIEFSCSNNFPLAPLWLHVSSVLINIDFIIIITAAAAVTLLIMTEEKACKAANKQ